MGLPSLEAQQHRGSPGVVGVLDVPGAPRQQERVGVGVDDRADVPHLPPRRFRETGVLVEGALAVLHIRKDAGVHGGQRHLAGQAGAVHGEQRPFVAVVVVPDEHRRGPVQSIGARRLAHRRGVSPGGPPFMKSTALPPRMRAAVSGLNLPGVRTAAIRAAMSWPCAK